MMTGLFPSGLAAVVGLALMGVAVAGDMPAGVGVAETSVGKVLTDQKGMTLYTFDKDGKGTSACTGPCAANWPPLQAAAGAAPTGEFSVTDRDDGTKQWAYKGMPLYGWIKDGKPGDVTGDGFKGVWRVARP